MIQCANLGPHRGVCVCFFFFFVFFCFFCQGVKTTILQAHVGAAGVAPQMASIVLTPMMFLW